MNDPLRQTLIDVVEFLEGRQVSYALVGGLAASVRGQPRVTADVDLVIAVDVDEALALLENIDDSQFEPLFPDVAEIVRRAFILPLRHRATGLKADLAIGLSGFERQAVGRAEAIELAGRSIFVATAEDLIIMKTLAGRPQDEQDLQGIVMARGSRLDWAYCLGVAKELGDAVGQDLLARVLALRRDYQSDS